MVFHTCFYSAFNRSNVVLSFTMLNAMFLDKVNRSTLEPGDPRASTTPSSWIPAHPGQQFMKIFLVHIIYDLHLPETKIGSIKLLVPSFELFNFSDRVESP